MFQRFRTRRRNRAIVDALYGEVVMLARAPRLFVKGGIPDTVMGRFEALAIHMFLLLRRCRADAALAPLAQDVVDRFAVDVEHSLRELGVGDLSVPKRIRKLTGQFYERVSAYDAAMAGEAEEQALAAALRGRAAGSEAARDAAEHLAAYMKREAARLDLVPASAILQGRLGPEER